MAGPADTQALGQRVRVTLRGDLGTREAGTLRGIRNDSLLLGLVDGTLRPIALSDVSRLEQSGGRRRNTVEGALIGLGVGLGAIAAAALIDSTCTFSVNDRCMVPMDYRLSDEVAKPGLVGATVVIGALLGLLVETEPWQTLALPRAELLTNGDPPGFRLGLSIPLPPILGSTP